MVDLSENELGIIRAYPTKDALESFVTTLGSVLSEETMSDSHGDSGTIANDSGEY
jgi:hypothetical protein